MRRPALHLRLGTVGSTPACGHGAPALGAYVTADAARVTCRRCQQTAAWRAATEGA